MKSSGNWVAEKFLFSCECDADWFFDTFSAQQEIMPKSRKIFLMFFILVTAAGMWIRYRYDVEDKSKRENLLRSLATYNRAENSNPAPGNNIVDEKRDIFDSSLSAEMFASIKTAVGAEFKIKQVTIGDTFVRAEISIDGQSVKVYQRFKNANKIEAVQDAVLLGNGKLSDVLIDPVQMDLGLISKIAKESLVKVDLRDPHIEMVAFGYSIGLNSDNPEWYVLLEGEKDGKIEDRSVIFDLHGHFKRVLG